MSTLLLIIQIISALATALPEIIKTAREILELIKKLRNPGEKQAALVELRASLGHRGLLEALREKLRQRVG